jgi:phosphoglycerate dehydrogenase-like enzyme
MDRILLLGLNENSLTPAQVSRIQALVPDMRIVRSLDKAEVEVMLGDIEIVAGRIPLDLIARASNLRWIQQWGAGADWLLRHPEAREMDFILTNASGVHAVPIGEHVFAFLLAFARNIPDAVRAQDERVWIGNAWQRHGASIRADQKFAASVGKDDVFELAGKTLLIVGLGAIGERTARLARAFDMRVVGVRRNPAGGAADVDELIGPDQLFDALPEADFVVDILPMTAATRHLFDRRAFAAMKPDAYFINVGRGGTVDEAALIEALRAGEIAGAGLDVFEEEPLPEDSPLWGLTNAIITSHYAGLTPEYDNRAFAIFIDNLGRYQRGEPLRNVVDKRLGY